MLKVAKRDEKANIVANPIKNCVSSRSGYSSRICISRSHCTCKWFSNLKRFRWNLSNVAAWKMLEVAKRDEKANIAAKDCVAHWEEHRIDLLNPNTTTANQELPCSVTLWKQIFAILFKNSKRLPNLWITFSQNFIRDEKANIAADWVVHWEEHRMTYSETNRETSVIIPLLITVLFQIRTLVSYYE